MFVHNLLFFLWFSILLVNGLPQNDSIYSKSCEVIEKETGKSKPCQFPFIYNNETFFGCTTASNNEIGQTDIIWCSTKTDQLDEHDEFGSYFGECLSKICPSAEQGLKAQEEEINLQIDLLKPIDTEDTLSTCKCQNYSSCEWSTKIKNQLSELKEQSHPFYVSRNNFYKNRICNKKRRHVWCCRDGDFPRPQEIRILNKKESAVRSTLPIFGPFRSGVKKLPEKDSGSWRPNGKIAECGIQLTLEHITGGVTARLGGFPYMALLGYKLYDNSVTYGCGGSLINKWYVLTAAHCVHWLEIEEIVLGDWKVSTDPDCARNNKKRCVPKKIVRKVGKIIKHEDFQPTDPKPENITNGENYRNDIALIRLNEAVPLFNDDPSKSFALPVCLPWPEYVEDDHPAFDIKEFKSKNKPVRNDFVITGWGKRFKDNKLEKPSEQTFSDSLLKAKVPVTNSIEGCAKHLIDSTQICAGGIEGPLLNNFKRKYHGKDSCQGDSGGPAVVRYRNGEPWYQVGIVSFGPKNCGHTWNGIPGVYTKVSAFLTWIKNNLED